MSGTMSRLTLNSSRRYSSLRYAWCTAGAQYMFIECLLGCEGVTRGGIPQCGTKTQRGGGGEEFVFNFITPTVTWTSHCYFTLLRFCTSLPRIPFASACSTSAYSSAVILYITVFSPYPHQSKLLTLSSGLFHNCVSHGLLGWLLFIPGEGTLSFHLCNSHYLAHRLTHRIIVSMQHIFLSEEMIKFSE